MIDLAKRRLLRTGEARAKVLEGSETQIIKALRESVEKSLLPENLQSG